MLFLRMCEPCGTKDISRGAERAGHQTFAIYSAAIWLGRRDSNKLLPRTSCANLRRSSLANETHKTPPFRTERKGGVSVGKTVVDYFQGYTRSEQTLPGSFLPYKGRIVFEVLFCHFPFAIELVMLGTHFVMGRTIQFQPVYACLNLLLQRGRQLRVGKNMPAYKFQIKPTILDFKRNENIREVPFAAVYCGTGQTVIAPFVRKIRA